MKIDSSLETYYNLGREVRLMKLNFFPKTKLGKWSIALFLLLVLSLSFFFIMVNVFDQRGGDTFFSNLLLTIPMLIAWTAGAISFFLGLTTMIKSGSKSILVIIVVILTFLTTLFGILEVLSPH